MPQTTVHNLRHEKMLPEDVRIDRRTDLGNPYIIGRDGTRDDVVRKFERAERAKLSDTTSYGAQRRALVKSLHGRRLFCWCYPLPCHGNVLAKLAAELVENNSTQ